MKWGRGRLCGALWVLRWEPAFYSCLKHMGGCSLGHQRATGVSRTYLGRFCMVFGACV